jgi:predicted extracellular nuclease
MSCTRHTWLRIAFVCAAALAPVSVITIGSASLSALDVPYTQTFDSLAASGTSSVTPPGWEFSESGTNANTTYVAGTGSGNAGDTYSFGAAGSTDRAFGMLQSGSLIPTIGARFTNDTGETIQSIAITYTGEQWRLGTSGRTDRLDFQYSTNATSIQTGTWIDVDTLDFNAPNSTGTVGLRNGNAAENRTTISSLITNVNIPAGATFWIRWSDFNASGADDGLAVDDFSITSGADAAPAVASTVPEQNATNVPSDSNIVLTFSEPVTLDQSLISIVCTNSGAQTFVLSGGPQTYTLNPDVDFGAGETCTVTVPAAAVSDADAEDPPDHLGFNFQTGFTTQEQCGDPFTFIHDIQGTALVSPRVGGLATVEGIVVADYQASGSFGGFYVQEEDANDDPASSEGIFVFTGGTPRAVRRGDHVRVSGTVTEFSNLTELTQVRSVRVCSSGHSVTPAPVTLPVESVAHLERYEGMLVTLPQDLTVSEHFSLARFGEVVLSANGRLPIPTAVVSPGAEAIAQQDLNNRSRIVLDDSNNQQNIDPTRYPSGGLSASNTLRTGYTVHGVTGVLEERFGQYRVQPVGAIDFDASTNPRPSAPEAVGGNLKIASMNVLNYFNGDGQGGGFPTERGAEDLEEFARQRDKVIRAMLRVDADLYGLLEIENDPLGGSALEDVVSGLNDEAGAGTFSFIDTGTFGGDLIRSAIVYKPATLTPIGAYKLLDASVDPRWIDRGNRPALTQTFESNLTGGRFTVSVNHLRSKGSSCDSATSPFGDPDVGDGQGNCNKVRTAAATALVQWLATDPTGSGDPDFLIIGDLNSYAKEDPITAMVGAGYTDLVGSHLGASAYSFVFGGQSGYIDHALASPDLVRQVTGVTEWHINADEPVALDYNKNFKTPNQVTTFYAPDEFRSADHDPLIVGLDVLNDPQGAFLTGGGWIPSGENKLHFALVAKYHGDSAVPTGNAEVRIGARGLKFRATSFEWLAVPGSTARLRGIGELDGALGYRFLITAVDGAVDSFGIKIWSQDDRLIFDSGAPQVLGGGSMIVHR